MAIVNPGPAGPIDMRGLQLANLQYGNVPVYDGGLVRVDNGGGRYVDFRGAFTYPTGGGGGGYGYMYAPDAAMGAPSDYYPTGGAIAQVTEVTAAGVALDVSGLSVSAPALFAMAAVFDGAGIVNAVFAANDVFNGSAGDDWMDGYGGDDLVAGNAGNDSVRGLDGADVIDGGAGNDDVNGNRGEDQVRGGGGADIVRGGQENDTVSGGDGDDPHVNGNIGNDIVHGDAGNDQVFGGQNNDQLFGDDGNDTLSGDLGDDLLTGGAGADRFQFRPGGGHDTVLDFNFAEGDRILIAPGQAFTATSVGGQAAIDLGGGDVITISGAVAALNEWVVTA